MGEPIRRHPLQRVSSALRVWLGFFVVVMTFNAIVSVPILLPNPFRPIPFLTLAVVGAIWNWRIDSGRVTIACSGAICVGVGMRGLEVLMYADQFTLGARLTGASLWMFVSATTFTFGFLNLVVISRRVANAIVEVPDVGDT